MILIDIQIDGGAEKFQRALDIEKEGLKHMSSLFEMFIAYFEGKDVKGINFKSPILRIYESEGAEIKKEWTISAKYDKWKTKAWKKERLYNVPIDNNNKQVLTGATLYSFLNPGKDSIRKVSNTELVYGSSVEWAYKNQMKQKILDFFPAMIREMDSITARWVRDISPALELKGD